MKRWLPLLLIISLLVPALLVGCTSGDQEAAPGTNGEEADEKKIDFPTKPVEITVLFGAGGGQDLIVRKLAEIGEEKLGQPFVVVNRTGAGGAVGYTYVKDQKPDGYNIVASSNSISTAYHKGNMDFDYRTFRGIAMVVKEPVSIAVKADAPWKTLDELFAYAKEHPGEIKIGNSGVGSFTHLTGVAVSKFYGADVVHVPFGKGLAVSALLGEKIDASVQLAAEVMNQVEAGTVRLLAVTGDKRIEAAPDVPTLKEYGYDGNLTLYRSFHAPKDTPDEVIAILEEVFKYAVESEEFAEFAKELGVQVSFMGAEELDEFVAKDDADTARLMELIGLKK